MDREYIKECDCKEIQEKWKPKVGDIVWKGRKYLPIADACGIISALFFDRKKSYRWLPRIEDLLKMLGDRFKTIVYSTETSSIEPWTVIYNKPHNKADFTIGKTPELALIRSVKSLKGR